MLSNQIISTLDVLKSGGQSAPLLLSEIHICEVFEVVYGEQISSLDDVEERGISDFLYYNCGDKENGHHKAENVREFAQKLYQKPAGDILMVIFRHIDILTDTSANALLRVFEDVPAQVLILMTSASPAKIIPTLLSRTLIIDGETTLRGTNPLQESIDAFVNGKPEALFRMTLAPSKESKFTRVEALWVIQGLQDAVEYGTLPTRHAKSIRETRLKLETTNTIAKYLIDQLLITISCE